MVPSLNHLAGAEPSNTKAGVSALFFGCADGLALVEQRISERFVSDAQSLSEISRYLLSLGGKRIRPLLALSVARLFGMNHPSAELVDAAAGIELIHMATLLHDDIIDESPTRRHKTSAYRKFGLAPSLLTGDFLLARAFGLCSHLDRFVVDCTETACVELTEGELLEGTIGAGQQPTLDGYISVVEKKTASLFSLAATVGSHLAGAKSQRVNTIRDFGKYIGVTFQMVDDILDITAEEDLLGKPTGTDLRQKTPSLVNVLWLNSGDKRAKKFFESTSPTLEQSSEAAAFLRSSSVLIESRSIATEYASRARAALCQLPRTELVESVFLGLCALIDFTLARGA